MEKKQTDTVYRLGLHQSGRLHIYLHDACLPELLHPSPHVFGTRVGTLFIYSAGEAGRAVWAVLPNIYCPLRTYTACRLMARLWRRMMDGRG